MSLSKLLFVLQIACASSYFNFCQKICNYGVTCQQNFYKVFSEHTKFQCSPISIMILNFLVDVIRRHRLKTKNLRSYDCCFIFPMPRWFESFSYRSSKFLGVALAVCEGISELAVISMKNFFTNNR